MGHATTTRHPNRGALMLAAGVVLALLGTASNTVDVSAMEVSCPPVSSVSGPTATLVMLQPLRSGVCRIR